MPYTLYGFLLFACSGLAAAQVDRGPNPPIQARISYTGDLFGYVRLPNEQSARQNACPSDDSDANDIGKKLISMVTQPPPKGVLVGVGNNFSPELFSRLIDPSHGG